MDAPTMPAPTTTTRNDLPCCIAAVSLQWSRRATRRGSALDAQNVIASIDKLHCAGDPTGEITAQIQRRFPDFFDRDIAAQRGPFSVLLEHIGKTGDSPGRGGFDRPGRNGGDADAEWPEVVGEIAHTVLQRRFGQGHDVVVGDNALTGHVCEGKYAALVRWHERGSRPGHGNQGIGTDIHGSMEPTARNLTELAL